MRGIEVGGQTDLLSGKPSPKRPAESVKAVVVSVLSGRRGEMS